MTRARQIKGALAFRAGWAAEESVARLYEDAGLPIVARRWRGKGGEMDLIARNGAGFVFIEVKASQSHDAAAYHLSPRQITRLFAAASEFVAQMPLGSMTEMRFDVALVDAIGRVEILENALAG